MRSFAGVVLAIVIAAAIGFVFYDLWSDEHVVKESKEMVFKFPSPNNVTSITVLNSDGTFASLTIQNPERIKNIMDELRAAPQSFFGDPELRGVLYRVEMRSDKETTVFELNDLRGMGSIVSGKIYPENPEMDEVWSVSADFISKLAGDELPLNKEPPYLSLSLPNGNSGKTAA